MAEEPNSVAAWPKEHVPDEDVLFLRVHQNYLRGRAVLIPPGVIPPGVFANKPTDSDGMSTNWKKYCFTAAEARARAKEPLKNAVVEAKAGLVRSISSLSVEHTPTQIDRSHCEVFGEKTTQVRAKLSSIFRWALPLESLSK